MVVKVSNIQELKRRRIIIATELAGLSHATTRAAIELFESGVATTTRVVTVGPWATFAARHLAPFDCGVALNFTSDNPLFPLAPITASPTLTDGRGFFPSSRAEFWDFADPVEVLRECRAQIERAIDLGLNPTHISSLDDALILRPEFFDVFIEVATEFNVAICPGTTTTISSAGYSPQEVIAEEDLVSVDAVVNFADFNLNSTIEALMSFEKALENATGTIELSIEAALESQESLDIFGKHRASIQRHSLEALTSNRARLLLHEYQIETISYQSLVDESSM